MNLLLGEAGRLGEEVADERHRRRRLVRGVELLPRLDAHLQVLAIDVVRTLESRADGNW